MIVVEALEDRVVPGRLEQRQERPEQGIQEIRRVAHIDIEGSQPEAQMIFRLVVQPGAAERAEPLADRPLDQVPYDDEIEVDVEGDRIIEADVLRIQ